MDLGVDVVIGATATATATALTVTPATAVAEAVTASPATVATTIKVTVLIVVARIIVALIVTALVLIARTFAALTILARRPFTALLMLAPPGPFGVAPGFGCLIACSCSRRRRLGGRGLSLVLPRSHRPTASGRGGRRCVLRTALPIANRGDEVTLSHCA